MAGTKLADAHARGVEGLEQSRPGGHNRPAGRGRRGIAGKFVSRLQERLGLAIDRTKGSFLERRMADRLDVGSRDPSSSAIRNLCSRVPL